MRTEWLKKEYLELILIRVEVLSLQAVKVSEF